jgi:hypothetical protein
MSLIIQQLLFGLGVPLLFLVTLIWYRNWSVRLFNLRNPSKEKLLRPPGESLRQKIENLDEDANLWICALMFCPMAISILPTWQWSLKLMIVAPLSGVLSLVIFRKFKQRADYWLGFQAERAVAEELNQLMRRGCHIFHDLQTVESGNIDHVVVAPTGVFAVETKARRKRGNSSEKKQYTISYDGKMLRFPSGSNFYSLEQTRRNAAWLSERLTRALAETIRVVPVLTFPGWWIDRTGKGEVNVVSYKELHHVIFSSLGTPLSEKQMKQIAAWLEEQCRNVQF